MSAYVPRGDSPVAGLLTPVLPRALCNRPCTLPPPFGGYTIQRGKQQKAHVQAVNLFNYQCSHPAPAVAGKRGGRASFCVGNTFSFLFPTLDGLSPLVDLLSGLLLLSIIYTTGRTAKIVWRQKLDTPPINETPGAHTGARAGEGLFASPALQYFYFFLHFTPTLPSKMLIIIGANKKGVARS